MSLEAIDRRLFLRGLMLTSSGLVVPKPTLVYVARRPVQPLAEADVHRLIGGLMRAAWIQKMQHIEAATWPRSLFEEGET